MSNDSTTQFLDLLENFVDNGNRKQEAQKMADILNKSSSLDFKQIEWKISSHLESYDFFKIKRFLQALEYLTVHCQDQLVNIISKEAFVEKFSTVLFESDLTSQGTNLLKLWSETYSSKENQLKTLFELINNLPMFGFSLPDHYKSSIDSLSATTEQASGSTTSEASSAQETAQEGFIGPKRFSEAMKKDINDLLERANKVRNEGKKMLNDPVFDHKTKAVKVEDLRRVISKCFGISTELQDLQRSGVLADLNDMVESVINEMKECRNNLQNKLIAIETQTEYHQHSQGTDYKIQISSVDNTMEIEELFLYKSQPCEFGQMCPHYPSKRPSGKQKLSSGFSKEIHCPYWHNYFDKRRPVCDENSQILYSTTLCKNWEHCNRGDVCQSSHNLFESLFHPSKYKKNRCQDGEACKNGKYCPYYHTPKEKEVWAKAIKQYFNTMDDDDEDIRGWAADVGNHSSGMEVESGFRIRPSQNSPSNIEHNKHHYQELEDKDEKPNENIYTKTLHSTLIIKKKYEDPSKMSQLFHNSTIFSGYPFFVRYLPSSKNPEQEKNSNKQNNPGEQEK